MKTLIIVAGLPGSGKSTYLKAHYLNKEHTFIVDSDETRRAMFGDYLTFPKNMYEIYDHMIEIGNEIYDKNEELTLVMDSTFLDNYRRNYYIDHLKPFDKYIFIMFHTKDININLRNNKLRIKEKWVPESVILEMVKQYEPLDDKTRARFNEVIDLDVK